MAEQEQQVFFVDDELVERLLRGDAPVPSKPARPASAPSVAEAVQQAAGGQLDDAAKTLETAGEQGEDPAEVYSAMGHVRFEQQRWEEAAECYSKAGDAPVHRYNLGLALVRQGKFSEAAASFEAALNDARLWQARAGLGYCLLHDGQWEAAIAHFDAVLDRQPAHERSLFGKAVALHRLGRLDDAWDLYRRLLPTNPDSEELIANMLSVSVTRGDQTKTREYAEYLLKIRPGNKTALDIMAHVHAHAGVEMLQRGDYPGAADCFEKCLEQRPDWRDALAAPQLAIAVERQDLKTAWDLFEQAKAEAGHEVVYNLGIALQKSGQRERAADCYRAAIEKSPEFAPALLNLGHVLEVLGQGEEARQTWARAVEADKQLASGYFGSSA